MDQVPIADWTFQGVACFVVVIVVRWMLTQHSRQMADLISAIHVNSATVIALQKELLAHDLTTSVMNPAAAAGEQPPPETYQKAIDKYERLQGVLTDLQQAVLSCATKHRTAEQTFGGT